MIKVFFENDTSSIWVATFNSDAIIEGLFESLEYLCKSGGYTKIKVIKDYYLTT